MKKLIIPAFIILIFACSPRLYKAHEMVLVEPGTFYMGSDTGNSSEKPIHKVTLTRPYLIGVYEVTFEQYDAYTKAAKKNRLEPEEQNRGTRPAMGMDWLQAVAYCNWLSEMEGLIPCYDIRGANTKCDFDANGYRLPTEAEWEFAAKGGIKSSGYIYAGGNQADEVAWYIDNSGSDYHQVGLKKSNELGLYDMSGNMWEWCWDYWDHSYYEKSPAVDPAGPISVPKQDFIYEIEKSRRSSRWLNTEKFMTTSNRSADFIKYGGDNGIRLVRTKMN